MVECMFRIANRRSQVELGIRQGIIQLGVHRAQTTFHLMRGQHSGRHRRSAGREVAVERRPGKDPNPRASESTVGGDMLLDPARLGWMTCEGTRLGLQKPSRGPSKAAEKIWPPGPYKSTAHLHIVSVSGHLMALYKRQGRTENGQSEAVGCQNG